MARIALLSLCAALLAGCSNVATAERPAGSATPVRTERSAPSERPARPAPTERPTRSCVLPRAVVPIGFSATKYPHIRSHYERALADGFPAVLVLNRDGADRRRDRLLSSSATRRGMDRDEYPPALGRSSVRASVRYVPSSENRSHGATLGIKLRRYCDGTRFRYVFY
jgi:hypothetical protein